jgi:hypothetical protein
MRRLHCAVTLCRLLFIRTASDDPRDKADIGSGGTNNLPQKARVMDVRVVHQQHDSRPQFSYFERNEPDRDSFRLTRTVGSACYGRYCWGA